jgi:hypothetical protein
MVTHCLHTPHVRVCVSDDFRTCDVCAIRVATVIMMACPRTRRGERHSGTTERSLVMTTGHSTRKRPTEQGRHKQGHTHRNVCGGVEVTRFFAKQSICTSIVGVKIQSQVNNFRPLCNFLVQYQWQQTSPSGCCARQRAGLAHRVWHLACVTVLHELLARFVHIVSRPHQLNAEAVWQGEHNFCRRH